MLKKLVSVFLILFFSHCYAADQVTNTVTSEQLSNGITKSQIETTLKQPQLQKRSRLRVAGVDISDSLIAPYVKAWEQKVANIFLLTFPKDSDLDNKHGTVMLTAAIKPDGSLKSVNITRSSGYHILDTAVVDTVRKAAPYSNFSAEMLKQMDTLEITRSFTIDHEESQ
jgi:protein TonB